MNRIYVLAFIIAVSAVVIIIDHYFWSKKNKPVAFARVCEGISALREGDFIVTWGSGWISYIVSRLAFFGHWTPNAPTHVMHVGDQGFVYTAESSGYKCLNAYNKFKKDPVARMMVFRFGNPVVAPITNLEYGHLVGAGEGKWKSLFELRELSKKFLGRVYDYFYYALRFLWAAFIFIPIFTFASNYSLLTVALIASGSFVTYTLIVKLLMKSEAGAAHCSETELYLAKKVGFIKTTGDQKSTTHKTPLDFADLALNSGVLVIDVKSTESWYKIDSDGKRTECGRNWADLDDDAAEIVRNACRPPYGHRRFLYDGESPFDEIPKCPLPRKIRSFGFRKGEWWRDCIQGIPYPDPGRELKKEWSEDPGRKV